MVNQSIQDDWQGIDGVEEVTLVPKNRAASSVPLVRALRRTASQEELSFRGSAGLTAEVVIWHLWTSTIAGGQRPEPLDQIVDSSGAVWSVRACSLQTMQTRWRCVCNKMN